MVLFTAKDGRIPTVPINAESGGTNRALFVVSPVKVNYKQAVVVQLDSLDAHLASGNSIAPGTPVRGWAAFRVEHFYGMDLRVNVIDGLNQPHQFIIPPEKQEKALSPDVMSRLIKFVGLIDVPRCERRVRMPVPPPLR
jgi:hypothetical protein